MLGRYSRSCKSDAEVPHPVKGNGLWAHIDPKLCSHQCPMAGLSSSRNPKTSKATNPNELRRISIAVTIMVQIAHDSGLFSLKATCYFVASSSVINKLMTRPHEFLRSKLKILEPFCQSPHEQILMFFQTPLTNPYSKAYGKRLRQQEATLAKTVKLDRSGSL